MSETDDDKAMPGIIEDIAELARKVAAQEPFKSATGPEALLAFAMHLDGMIAKAHHDEVAEAGFVVRSRRNRAGGQ